MKYWQHTLLVLAWLAAGWLCAGCSAEDIQAEAPDAMGVLCLRMSSDEAYAKVETRAAQPLDDWTGFTFKLNGNSITFTDDGLAIIPAGTYTLSATNSDSDAVGGGYTGALYEGSTDFTLNAGEQKEVTLSLGAPKNAKVTVALDETFTSLYTFSSLALNDGTETKTLTSTIQAVFFPATDNTTLYYTLVANAKQGSHVQDITAATGTVTIATGKHTNSTLSVNPITGYITIESGEPYTGEFQ